MTKVCQHARDLSFKKLPLLEHLRPVIHLDAELAYVAARDAVGIDAYRSESIALLGNRKPDLAPHEDVIESLDKSAKLFRVLILKTD